jgi:hemerythrin-like domain-containing protein
VVLDDDDLIRRANDKAVSMGFVSGTTLANYIVDLMEKFVDHVCHHPKHVYLAWNFSMEEKCGASFEENSSELYVWLVEALGQLVLANQIRQVKQRESLKMRPVNQLIVTAARYSELLDVILADNYTLGSG